MLESRLQKIIIIIIIITIVPLKSYLSFHLLAKLDQDVAPADALSLKLRFLIYLLVWPLTLSTNLPPV
jgi:hypothetical protein